MYVKDFPTIVVIDSKGNNLYETVMKEWFYDFSKDIMYVGSYKYISYKYL
jgi:tartrate dehydratase beta subunit/fumarate hydratase class I family protein